MRIRTVFRCPHAISRSLLHLCHVVCDFRRDEEKSDKDQHFNKPNQVIFLYPWAIVFNKIGLIGLVEMLIFIGLFLVAYVYAWRKGALEWD